MDDYSRVILFFFFLVDKTQVERTTLDYFGLVQRQINKHMKIVWTHGSKFLRMRDYFHQLRVIHETSCVGTP